MARDDTLTWIGGLALGAAAMYFLDPDLGRRRRSGLQQRLTNPPLPDLTGPLTATEIPELEPEGVPGPLRRLSLVPVEDPDLEASVRTALPRLSDHPRAIRAVARDGIVVLTGVILEREVGPVLAGLRGIKGLRRVECQLRTVKDASIEPALQGNPFLAEPDVVRERLLPVARAVCVTAGGLMVLWGARRGGFPGLLSSATGGALLTGAANALQNGPSEAPAAGEGITVGRTIEVDTPVRDVFAFWTQFRNFPRFMTRLREVREEEPGVSHWLLEGPAGVRVSWDAEVTALEPHERIAWRSLPGSTLPNAGEVRFEELDIDRTRVHVSLAYHPPAGALGHAVAWLFGTDPHHQLEGDLQRFKSLVERP